MIPFMMYQDDNEFSGIIGMLTNISNVHKYYVYFELDFFVDRNSTAQDNYI